MGERPALAYIVKKEADILRYLYREGGMNEGEVPVHNLPTFPRQVAHCQAFTPIHTILRPWGGEVDPPIHAY